MPSFDFSPFNNINPYQKIAVFGTLVEDPEDKDSYPNYLGKDKNGVYRYQSKDNKSTFLVEPTSDGHGFHIVKRDFSTFSNETGLEFDPGGVNRDYKRIGKRLKLDEKGSTVPGFEGGAHVAKGKIEYTRIYDDGSKFNTGISGSAFEAHAEIRPNAIAANVDILNLEGKGIYYPTAVITVDKNNVGDVKYGQTGIGFNLGGNIGAGGEWKGGERPKLDAVPVSVSGGLELDFSHGKLNEASFLTVKDRLQLENEAIGKILNKSQSPEEAAAFKEMISQDPDRRGFSNDRVTLTDEQRKALESKKSENNEILKTLDGSNEAKDVLDFDKNSSSLDDKKDDLDLDKNSSSLDDDLLDKQLQQNSSNATFTPSDETKNDAQNAQGISPDDSNDAKNVLDLDKNSSSLDDDLLDKQLHQNSSDARSAPTDTIKNETQNGQGITPSPLGQGGPDQAPSGESNHQLDHLSFGYNEILQSIQESIDELKSNLSKA